MSPKAVLDGWYGGTGQLRDTVGSRALLRVAGHITRSSRRQASPSPSKLHSRAHKSMSRHPFSRYPTALLLVASFLSVVSGCSSPPPSWPHSGVVIVYMEPLPTRHACTGTVVQKLAATMTVLTARHCVVHAAHATDYSVGYSRSSPSGEHWTVMPARLLHTGDLPDTPGHPKGPWEWQDGDWALLSFDTQGCRGRHPSLDGDPETVIPRGDPVQLVSCLDTTEPVPRCHVHTFAFGDEARN